MRKLASLLLVLLIIAAMMPTAVTAESREPSVKLIVPEGKVPLDEPIEITLELSGLDENFYNIIVYASNFFITDPDGHLTINMLSISRSDLPDEAFGDKSGQVTVTLKWIDERSLPSGKIIVGLVGKTYGTFVTDEEGTVENMEPYSDSCLYVANDDYIAFSAVSEENAAAKLDVVLWPWIVGGVSVTLLVAVGGTVLAICLRKLKKSLSSAKS